MPGRAATANLVREIMGRKGSFPTAEVNPCILAVATARAQTAGASVVERRAASLLEQVRLAPVEIEAGWTLAGVHLPRGCGAGTVLPDTDDPAQVAQLAELGIDGGDVAGVREAVEAWEAMKRERSDLRNEEGVLGAGAWKGDDSRIVFMANGWTENHSIRDYAKVLRLGYAGIREEIAAVRDAADPADPDHAEHLAFWHAAELVCEAGALLGRRYAEEANRLVGAATGDDRRRLEDIAVVCARVPERGARSLAEAVQALWLAHLLTCGEDGINANSLGRLDQVLQPYYQADLDAGRIDRAVALALMEELACRLYLTYDVQAITLGGVDAAGNDAACEMSHLFLEATENVGFVRDLSVRLHTGSPEDFTRKACALMARGGGIPFLFNDECFVPALVDRGIALEDARDYAPIGCIELTVPGKANPHAVSGWFNALKCLELALFDGIDPRSGTRLGPATGRFEDCASFGDLLASWRAQVDEIALRMVERCGRGETAQRRAGPLPCWSTLTDDCIRRGRDITDGGAEYFYHSVCLLGVPDTADALMALKRLVFEQGRIDRGTLIAALRADWEGHEPLRQRLLNGAPKYGNDVAEVDELARLVADHFIDLMDRQRSPLGGRFFVHLFSFLINLPFGRNVGATPDGRRAGEPLAYSLSAHQGRDVEGVTAMLNSLARLPHARSAGATAAIIEVDPVLLEGPEGEERLHRLTRAAVAMGVGQLQWNVVTVERLRQAQEDPERYGNLAVRVAGYSQMFKLINKELQEHIIARTKHRA